MAKSSKSNAKVVPFSQSRRKGKSYRKFDLNRNKEGSVRKVNDKVYVDFMYMGERVRESSGLPWNEQNAKGVRQQLDKINAAIESEAFRFSQVFPNSKNRDYFSEKERLLFGLKKSPDQVLCKEYIREWYDLKKSSKRNTGRTLHECRGYLEHYLIPFFGKMKFADLNLSTFERFVSWARQRQLRGKSVGNNSINKYLDCLQTICKQAAIEYGWGNSYNPFFGFKKLPVDDPYEEIFPFSLEDQQRLIIELPHHWQPYFKFAFCCGPRPGEQIAIKPEDIDWAKKILNIRRAMTLDENGKKIEGRTKNKFSRRTIQLLPVMLEALEEQKKIYERFKGEYFFCTVTGKQVQPSNLRCRVWIPALKRAGLKYRAMKQTRHSFVTVALSCGENPLWIANVLGHRDSEMIHKVYGKYTQNAGEYEDGSSFNRIHQVDKGN